MLAGPYAGHKISGRKIAMRKVISTMLAAVLIVLPAVALPQSAQSILETARDKRHEQPKHRLPK